MLGGMPIRAIYIRLLPGELALLEAMADEERRLIQDQAAHLVSQALLRWSVNKELEASLHAEEATA